MIYLTERRTELDGTVIVYHKITLFFNNITSIVYFCVLFLLFQSLKILEWCFFVTTSWMSQSACYPHGFKGKFFRRVVSKRDFDVMISFSFVGDFPQSGREFITARALDYEFWILMSTRKSALIIIFRQKK